MTEITNNLAVDELIMDVPALTPAVVMSAHEAAFLSNPALVAQVAQNRANPDRLTRVDRRTRRG